MPMGPHWLLQVLARAVSHWAEEPNNLLVKLFSVNPFMEDNNANNAINADNLLGCSNVRILMWNVRGVGSREFMNTVREHICIKQPHILTLLEMHISGPKADEGCNKIGYQVRYRVDAQGFQGSIWIP